MLVSTKVVGSARIIMRRNAEVSLCVEHLRLQCHVKCNDPLAHFVFNDLADFLINVNNYVSHRILMRSYVC